ncbi:MAG: hypothetical protein R3213_01695 [Flavobacteriaceae bacterium]|nr:hypothetical protein [Flavobacteriaceae bacterium]
MFSAGLLETPFRWVGKTILNINYEYDISGFGSGDHTYAYITLFVNAFLSFIVVFTWHFLDRNRPNYNKLQYWFLVVLRVFLVLAMSLYGFVKVFQVQFPQPSLIRLLEPLGNFSPMGLAWTYMGYSYGYNIFVGSLEILGGLLLIPRRTQTLGAFIVMGVMANVAMMNFMFDIPVKLFSVHLFLMAAVIFLTDIRRFTNVFVRNKSTASYQFYHPIKNRKYHGIIFKSKLAGFIVLMLVGIGFGFTQTFERGLKRELPFLYGIWEVENHILNGDTLPPLITQQDRWRYLVIDFPRTAIVKTMTDEKLNFNFIPDTTAKSIKIYSETEIDEANFSFAHPNDDILRIKGILLDDSLEINFKRKNLNDFLLKSRGFHWINERPRNE